MNKNQFKGLAYTKNVDALNYAPSNRAKGSLLRRDDGGEICETTSDGGRGCRKKSKSKSKGSSQESKGGVLGVIGAAIAGTLGGLGYKKMKERE
jgi:hypothetical protein